MNTDTMPQNEEPKQEERSDRDKAEGIIGFQANNYVLDDKVIEFLDKVANGYTGDSFKLEELKISIKELVYLMREEKKRRNKEKVSSEDVE